MYGMNDMGLWLYTKENDGVEAIEIEKQEKIELHKENYERIIKSIIDFGATPVVCLPTPYDEVSDVETEAASYQSVLELAAEFHLQIARKYGLQVVNFKDNLKPLLGKRNIIIADRVHPNKEGYHIMAQIFLKEIGEIDKCDFDTPFEFEPWNKERYDIYVDKLHKLRFVDLCIRYSGGTCKNNEELKAFVEEDYAKIEDKEKYVAKSYEAYLEYGEKYNEIRGEIIKRTIF